VDELNEYGLRESFIEENYLNEMDISGSIDFSEIKILKNENGTDKIIGQGIFISILNKGATSIVYLGIYNEKKVALKKFHNVSKIKEIKTEISILKFIESEYIVKFYGYSYDHENNNIYLLTDYAVNGSLYNFIHNVSKNNEFFDFDWKMKVKFIKQISNAFFVLHSNKPPLVHRDLKTENILLDENFDVKINDFGISKFQNYTLNTTLGNKGNLFIINKQGTPIYQSPEQFSNINNKSKFDTSSDVYSFGCVIYEIIFEITPWTLEKIDDFDDLKYKILNGYRPSIPSNSKHSKEPEYQKILNIMLNSWNTNPKQRNSFLKIEESLNKL
jgi:serine/threonine protein kinase